MPEFGATCSHLVLALCLCLLLTDFVKGQCQLPSVKIGLELTDQSASMDAFPEGSSVNLQCAKGYSKISGSGSIRCENGQWTAETLQCQKRSCGSPGEILNGKFETPEGIEYGATAHASCNLGYKLIGSAYRQCYDFGWNNRIPVCESVKCGDPPTISNGTITSLPSGDFYQFSEVVTYACNDKKFTLLGDASLTCNEHGEYSGTVPRCKDVTCPTPDVKNGFRVEGGPPPYKYKYSVIYECDDGFLMNGLSSLVCGENGWSAPIPTCVKVTKPTTTTTTTTVTPTTTKPGKNDTNLSSLPSPQPPQVATDFTWLYAILGIVGAVLFGLVIFCGCKRAKRNRSGGYRGEMTRVSPQEVGSR